MAAAEASDGRDHNSGADRHVEAYPGHGDRADRPRTAVRGRSRASCPRAARNEETTATMPKMKTHSGAAKRFKLTGTGKVIRRRANRTHLLEHKSSRRTRRLAARTVMATADVRKIKRLLGK